MIDFVEESPNFGGNPAQANYLRRHGHAINELILASPDLVLTADLPAAGPTMNGRFLMEDGGPGVCNLVYYKGSERFKIALALG